MRIILTTKKAEERDDARQREYQHQEEKRLAEESRRSDVDSERGLWCDILQAKLNDGCSTAIAIKEADGVLEAYRSRFQ